MYIFTSFRSQIKMSEANRSPNLTILTVCLSTVSLSKQTPQNTHTHTHHCQHSEAISWLQQEAPFHLLLSQRRSLNSYEGSISCEGNPAARGRPWVARSSGARQVVMGVGTAWMIGFSNVIGDGLSLAKRVLSGSVSSLWKLKIIELTKSHLLLRIIVF